MEETMMAKIKKLEDRLDALSLKPKEYLTIRDASVLYGWSRKKVFLLRNEGVIKFYRFPNTRKCYLKYEEVNALFKADELKAA